MTRYIKHKHGLTIGSDDSFCVFDRARKEFREPEIVLPEGIKDFRDGYNAIVMFNGYHFDRISSLNVQVRTPAQQIIWRDKTLRWEEPHLKYGTFPYESYYAELNEWATRWLEENVGPKYNKWDTYTRSRQSEGTIFFKRRKDALAFVRMIDKELKGIKLPKN